jgi:hypothetical protein
VLGPAWRGDVECHIGRKGKNVDKTSPQWQMCKLNSKSGKWMLAPSYSGKRLNIPLSRVPLSSFVGGGDVEAVREWAACRSVDTGLPAQLPHSIGDGRTGRVGGIALGYDSQAVSEGRRGGDSPLT